MVARMQVSSEGIEEGSGDRLTTMKELLLAYVSINWWWRIKERAALKSPGSSLVTLGRQ